ncbi:MAG: TGS domain-containing protein, partial [Calditrichaeota bacterium]|nr:TGS domain-containing protein [Calditrichota bacterium]
MNQINITFPDDAVRSYHHGVSGEEIAQSISPQFAKKVYAAKVNGNEQELRLPIEADSKIEFLMFDSPYGKETFWHSSSHVLAQAIKRLYPSAELGFGPAIENGFFYDIKYDQKLNEDDFEKIEAEIKKIIKENHQIVRKELSKDEAVAYFKGIGEHLKAEHITDIYDRGESI